MNLEVVRTDKNGKRLCFRHAVLAVMNGEPVTERVQEFDPEYGETQCDLCNELYYQEERSDLEDDRI